MNVIIYIYMYIYVYIYIWYEYIYIYVKFMLNSHSRCLFPSLPLVGASRIHRKKLQKTSCKLVIKACSWQRRRKMPQSLMSFMRWKLKPVNISLAPGGFMTSCLVVAADPSEKWWSSSVGMMTFPIYGKSYNSMVPVTTNQWLLCIINHHYPILNVPVTTNQIVMGLPNAKRWARWRHRFLWTHSGENFPVASWVKHS